MNPECVLCQSHGRCYCDGHVGCNKGDGKASDDDDAGDDIMLCCT